MLHFGCGPCITGQLRLDPQVVIAECSATLSPYLPINVQKDVQNAAYVTRRPFRLNVLLLRLLLLHRQRLLLPWHLEEVVRAREGHIILLVERATHSAFLLVERTVGQLILLILGEGASIYASELVQVLFLLLED